MAATEPNWSQEELALHAAYEQCPQLRQIHPTFERAMAEPLIAKALQLAARAWLKNQPKHNTED